LCKGRDNTTTNNNNNIAVEERSKSVAVAEIKKSVNNREL